MDDQTIEQLLDAGRDSRRQTAQTLVERQQQLTQLTRDLAAAQRALVTAWDDATAAGWTPAQLRQLQVSPPLDAWRPRKRIRKRS